MEAINERREFTGLSPGVMISTWQHFRLLRTSGREGYEIRDVVIVVWSTTINSMVEQACHERHSINLCIDS